LLPWTGACFSKAEDAMAPPRAEAERVAAVAPQSGEGRTEASGKDQGGKPVELDHLRGPDEHTERKLIRDAELHLEVQSYAEARKTVGELLAASKGYLATARIDHREGVASSAELELRIPAAGLDGFVAKCRALGTVLHESVSTRDITEEYYDLRARLDNARKLEVRLLELLATKTDEVKDLLEVERELARVREKIERFEGKLRLYDKQVALSTLKLRLTTRQVYSAGKPQSLGEQLSRTLGRSWQALVGFGRGLLVVLVALLPWLPLLLLLGWAGWRLLRWMGRKLASPPRAAYPAHAVAAAAAAYPAGGATGAGTAGATAAAETEAEDGGGAGEQG